MKYPGVIVSYLLSSFLPPITLLISGLIASGEDCSQCMALILVASILVLGKLLLIHAVQFFGLIRLKNRLWDFILVIFCSFSSSFLLLFYSLKDLIEYGEIGGDWYLLSIPACVNFLMGFFTFWVLTSIRKKVN
ncbi:hypothetical protein D3C87_65310 [compost metagenome]